VTELDLNLAKDKKTSVPEEVKRVLLPLAELQLLLDRLP
jgi:hypothetical protein